jgi:hypothetical protein
MLYFVLVTPSPRVAAASVITQSGQQKRGWTEAPRIWGRYPSAFAGCNRHCSAIRDPWRAEAPKSRILPLGV